MTGDQGAPANPERFTWLERPDDDFPYYRGNPVSIGIGQWLIVVAAVAVGFLALIYTQPVFRIGPAGFIPAILFAVIPLAALIFVARGGWTAIFRPLRGMDFVWMVAFYIINFILTLIVGFVVLNLFDAQSNPAGSIIAAASGAEKVLFFAKTAIQLFGEELFTILPFLALLTWLTAHMGVSRKMAIVVAALVVALIFALVHLPTYQWNVPQAVIGLVPIRIVLLLPYIMTKNIWVSTGTHIMNDWVTFGLPLILRGGE